MYANLPDMRQICFFDTFNGYVVSKFPYLPKRFTIHEVFITKHIKILFVSICNGYQQQKKKKKQDLPRIM